MQNLLFRQEYHLLDGEKKVFEYRRSFARGLLRLWFSCYGCMGDFQIQFQDIFVFLLRRAGIGVDADHIKFGPSMGHIHIGIWIVRVVVFNCF